MATVSNASSKSAMSNGQVGTRPVSSSDWIRMKRIRGSRGYPEPLDLAPAPQLPGSLPIYSSKVVGSSRIRNTASQWTDRKAWFSSDMIKESQNVSGGKILSVVQVCNCTVPAPYPANKTGNCIQCSHDPKWRNP
jgi:hypothetical protein